MTRIIDILDELARTESTNGKKAILEREKDNELLKRVFRMAYSKRLNYGIKKWPEAIECHGSRTLSEGLDMFEFELATRKYTGHEAIRRVAMLISDIKFKDPGEEEVLRRVIMRDLDCGAGTTLANKTWKDIIPLQPQMLASPYSEKALKHIKFPAFAQLKADGARCFAEIRGDSIDDVSMFSRAGNEYFCLDKLALQLIEMTKEIRVLHPEGVMIDGELVYREVTKVKSELDFLFGEEEVSKEIESVASRNTSNGLANKCQQKTITPDEADGMKFEIWDMVPLEEIYGEAKSRMKYDVRIAWIETNAVGFDKIIPIENHQVSNIKEARIIYQKYIAADLEGIILKNRDSYWENKRSKNLIKFKEVIDIAMEVTGYYQHSKDPTKLGGVNLRSSCGRITCNVGSGFTDTTHVRDSETKEWVYIPFEKRGDLDREMLMSLGDKLISRIADCQCTGWDLSKSRTDTVGLFLIVIKGWRFDKTRADTFSEVFGGDFTEMTGIK
ncbi:hypothetical protein fHeYen901_220 [Yersinia phage fHe-Yen9-01]|uniref:ATP-dependent DNA ligase family profile domain-containing protein n=1 Tax=Yersinia phage fHe-Yen9-01 TaxID=1965363 RepID=A0A1V0DXW4_9CAUD|nr:hypothetical protein KNT60_gp219 [Yersinia phage fHe-Yen9-01]ARB05993.1 hypothetical protein fHeYen901_220 [Yersinia phage fHe-Yen9-01]